ncbi:MAG TPA: MotA/TolQ/ExbB proton channel family protein [Blastocatellia bacterium]|nr:MotA/TolQ/ExbB proton channel family protein [Blastocatellia bacterium]
MKRPDLAIPLGAAVGLAAICVGAWMEGVRLGFLWQPAAALIVFGGTVGAVLVRRGTAGLGAILRGIASLFFDAGKEEIEATKARLTWLARLERREGAQALEAQATMTNDPLIAQSLTMISQYSDAHLVRERLERILDHEDERGLRDVMTLEGAASYAPTFGIVGAVLGLIQALRVLAEPAQLGVGIATAFVATIYGVGIANLILFPLAARLRERHNNHMRQREAIAEALVALAAHETPSAITRNFTADMELTLQKEKAYLR